MSEADNNYIENNGKMEETEFFFEAKVLYKLTKESEKYPLLTLEEEQRLIADYQIPRDLLYNEAQRVYGIERYPKPTSWESPGERGVIKAIITPGSPHYNAKAAEARKKIVLHNLRLLKKYGKVRKSGDLGPFDIFFEALKGIYRGLDKFDRNKVNDKGTPNKFSTYATWWIKHFSRRAVTDTGRSIRIPIHIRDQINKLGKIYAQLSAENYDSNPTPEQLSQISGIPIKQVKELGMIHSDYSITSLDKESFSDDEESNTLLDSISAPDLLPEDLAEKQQNKDYLEELFSTLAPDDAKFAKLAFGILDGEVRSVRELASVFGKTRKEMQEKIDSIMNILRANAVRDRVNLD